jgi:NAD(P)-dependent dehydrogenase (short-subunit alcohol dehydrogenase family)
MSTFLVTGANRGIGLELARQLQARGETVIATTRGPSPELDALGVRVETLDVTDADSIAALASRLDGVQLDVLIHNSGVLHPTTLGELDIAKMRQMIEVNSFGPLLLTEALLGNLVEGSKVAIVTSRMGSLSDNTSGGAYGYRMSKAAVNAAGKSLSIDLKPRGIAVGLLHPGWVRTRMTGGNGLVDAPESAAGLLARIDELTLAHTGSFVHMNGEPLPW